MAEESVDATSFLEDLLEGEFLIPFNEMSEKFARLESSRLVASGESKDPLLVSGLLVDRGLTYGLRLFRGSHVMPFFVQLEQGLRWLHPILAT